MNFGAISLAHEVLRNFPEIPFVWHFKESPFHATRFGLWEDLVYLYTHADGVIFINEEIKAWYEQFIPNMGLSFIMDGDLPKVDYFNNNITKRLSDTDNEIHTVIPGRMVGITPEHTQALARQSIHIHIYTENYHDYKMDYLYYLKGLSPNHIHLHSHCIPQNWVKEFSQYDAGWLHYFESNNKGDLLTANWEDLNIPARMATLAMAGLPMIQKSNVKHSVATQSIAKRRGVGVFFNDIEDLCRQLKDHDYINNLRTNMMKQRFEFSFDYHLPELILFFRNVIKTKLKHK